MNLKEITEAVDKGLSVHWSNNGYDVIKAKNGEYLIKFNGNGHCIGLTWMDGVTLNGKECDFYIESN